MDKNQEKLPDTKLKANMENNLIISKNNINRKELNTMVFSYISKLANIPINTIFQTSEISQVNDEESSKNNYPFYDDKMNNNNSKYINYLIFL